MIFREVKKHDWITVRNSSASNRAIIVFDNVYCRQGAIQKRGKALWKGRGGQIVVSNVLETMKKDGAE